jgi:2-C-methyl-D-erythritol 4-phosphate cytidylyltransferase
MKIFAVLPAGGKGKRSGFPLPKQFIKVNGKEIVVYTLEVFQKCRLVNEIAIAVEKEYFDLILKLKNKYSITKLKTIVEGGKERQDSVFNCLSALSAEKKDLVAVHDAARPLLPPKTLENGINHAIKNGNALFVIKAKDTIIKGDKFVVEYLNRNEIFTVQTPQIFNYKDLFSAMKKAYKENFIGTDESMLIKNLGRKIYLVEGSPLNFKITTKEDLELFKKIVISK